MLTILLTRDRRLAQRLLGGLIVWHLAYVTLTNLWGLFPSLPPEVIRYEMGEDLDHGSLHGRGVLGAAMDRWGELTGLWQGWALFAPNVPNTSAFLAVELQWDDDRCRPTTHRDDALNSLQRVKLLSNFEPHDLMHYWVPAWRDVRLYNYEWRLAVSAGVFDRPGGSTPTAEQQAIQREMLAQLVRRESKQFLALMRMRVRRYLQENPQVTPPDSVALVGRTFAAAPASQRPWTWEPCVETLLVRWRPGVAEPTDASALEYFDPAVGAFVPVRELDLTRLANR